MLKSNNAAVVRWISSVSGGAKSWPALQILVRVCQSGISILYAYCLGAVIDAAASGSMAAFGREFRLFALCSAVNIVLFLLRRYLVERSKNALDKAFRLRCFSQLLHRDYGQVSHAHSGEWMNHITSDTDIISRAISQIIPEIAGALVRIVGALVALYRIVPQITYILIPGGAVMLGASFLFQKQLKRYHKDVQQTDGKLLSFMQERLHSLLVIHAFTQEDATEAIAGQQMEQLNTVRMRRLRFILFCVAAINGAVIVAQLLGVGICGIGIIRGTVSYGMLSTVLYLVNMLETPLSTVSGYISQYYGMLASAERLMEIEKMDPDSTAAPIPQEEIQHYYTRQLASFGLENADFAYEDGDGTGVLQNFSLDVRKGEFVAFTGESGCGKSTALKVLLSLYPLQGGSLYLQSTAGHRQTLDASWRGLFAYVPQGNLLISGTIRQTLTFADPTLMSRDEQLYRALRIACAEDFVKDLPDGLDTVLGERGSGLSEGQMQRLSVARAILSQRPILLLDEATSALDAATEMQLLQNLRSMTDRTVLIITHREAALEFCDKQIRFLRPENT